MSTLFFSPIPITESLVRLHIHAAAHTPGVACVGLTVVVHKASAEVYEPGVGGIFGISRHRPIASRLDIVKEATKRGSGYLFLRPGTTE